MIETRAKTYSVVSNQIPEMIQQESPLFGEFLEQYYKSQESQGAPIDLAENIDQYIKNDSFRQQDLVTTTNLDGAINAFTKTIAVNSTVGFPERYGYLKIDNEIISYTSKDKRQFFGCARGFSAITSLFTSTEDDKVTFTTSSSAAHADDATVTNLSNLFLIEFFKKYKELYVPGLEDRSFVTGLDQALFAKQAKDLYVTKGTDDSFEILFRALYGSKASIIKPFEQTIKPSDADYRITEDLVVVALSGDPSKLRGQTLYQDAVDGVLNYSYGSIADVITYNRDGNKYYQISLDAGSDKDISESGSIYGKFSVTPTTRTVTDEVASVNTIYVDSTIGFPESGTLIIGAAEVTYTSRTTNQFLGLSGNSTAINKDALIRLKSSIYGYDVDGNKITVRITGVVTDFVMPGPSKQMVSGDLIDVQNLGILEDTNKSFTEWIYNVPNVFNIESVEDIGNGNHKITCTEVHLLYVGDKVTLINQSTNAENSAEVVDIPSNKIAILSGLGSIDLTKTFKARNDLIRAEVLPAVKQPTYKFSANVSNAYNLDVVGIVSGVPYAGPYHTHNGKKMVGPKHTAAPHDFIEGEPSQQTYVTSASIPYYANQQLNADLRGIEVKIAANFSGETISTARRHDFLTGDEVYYIPGTTTTSALIDGVVSTSTTTLSISPLSEGSYFAYKVDDQSFKLAYSRANLDAGKFIDLTGNSAGITTHEFASRLQDKPIDSQRLVRRFSEPVFDSSGKEFTTIPGEKTGMFVNGVELANYKSRDAIYYGELESVRVLNGGSGHDVINPPELLIGDNAGVGATGHVNVKGSFERIDVKYAGFDYLEKPQITISGGNGVGAKAEAKMKQGTHSAFLDVEVGINTSDNLVGFTTYHLFNAGERVFYRQNKGTAVGTGTTTLGDGAIYFVGLSSNTAITLHSDFDDSIAGINTVDLSDKGSGTQKFESVEKKNVVDKIFITNPGTGYEYKKRTVISTGINTAKNTINIKDHGYKNGEVITYDTTGSVISGLVTTTQYKVLVVDNNNFRVAIAGVGGTITESYDNGTYVRFTGVGVGTHIFNYQPISVSISGELGISSSLGDYHATMIPVVRGSVTSVDLTQNGSGYGNSSIVSYDRTPSIDFLAGSGAELRPVVQDGKIDQVIVTRGGTGYNAPPEIITSGIGTYATLTPVIENGVITSVTVVSGGVGFVTDRSFLSVETAVDAAGRAPVVKPEIKRWELDNVKRYKSLIKLDDGFMENSTGTFGSQFTHLYAPRKLREMLPSLKLDGTKDYGTYDLNYENAEEVSDNHSPILGFAYDGNPIYGPYGFDRIDGGTIRRMIPGYELNATRQLGPSVGDWELGSFTDDYTFTNKGDLDKYNGRFCKTPDYPSGTYAYFATIDSSSQQDATFDKYFTPVFPYAVGEAFKSKPDTFNFSPNSITDKVDLENGGYVRNIYPYKLSFNASDYPYVARPDKTIDDFASIVYAQTGGVESVVVENGGYEYKVNDRIVFDDVDTGGINAAAKVDRITGKSLVKISSSTTKKDNVTFEVLKDEGRILARTPAPHDFKDGDYISVSGISSQSIINLDGVYTIGVTTATFKVSTGIGSTGSTGIVTFIPINGDVDVLQPTDVIGISTEKLFVVNIDKFNSRVRVIREYDGTVGTAYTAGTIIEEKPRALKINVGINTNKEIELQKSTFFDPSEVVGLGTTSGVGINSTISVIAPGLASTDIAIPTRSIYLPNHNFTTGESLTYSAGGGTVVSVSTDGINNFNLPSQVYSIRLGQNTIGLTSMPVGMGSTGVVVGVASTAAEQLYFHSVGTGVTHSLTTQVTELTGILEKVVVTATATTAHGLGVGDTVFLDVLPGITSAYTIKYNEYNRKFSVGFSTFTQSGINTSANSITITNHGYSTGDKIIYESTGAAGGLSDNTAYFVIKDSNDSIKLATNYYNATIQYPLPIGLTSTAGADIVHYINPINPLINITRGQKLELNVADSSLANVSGGTTYSAYAVNFFRDKDFKHEFLTVTPDQFDVTTSGSVGISGGKIFLQTNAKTPELLYYNLTPVNPDRITTVQSEIVVDKTVKNYSTIKLVDSLYDGKFKISSMGSTTFSFNIPDEPECASYTDITSRLSYETTSEGALGGIANIKVTNKGYGYKTIPGISTVSRSYTGTAATTYGNGSILRVESDSIGNVKTTHITNPGYEFPYDKTLRPSASLPSLFKVDRFRTLDHIGLSSGGHNYSIPPKLIVKDRVSGLILNECEIKTEVSGSVGVSTVIIEENTKRLQDPKPTIIPIHNSNGVGIETVGFTTTTATVELTLDTDFSVGQDFPFAVGDKVLVEGVGIATTGFGYNSSEYDYNLFTLNSVTPNLGGANPTVSFILENDNPGEFSPDNSAGRIIPEKHFPGFIPVTRKGDFNIKEKITQESLTGTKTGTVIGWNRNNNTLRIATSDVFEAGKQIEGGSSNQVGSVQSIESFDSTFEVGPLVEQRKGFHEVTGFLNDSRQRIADNDYYQSFSYSIKSPIQYSDWKDVVSEITHTSGFKKFSDMELESFDGRPSTADEQGEGSYGTGGKGFPNAGIGAAAASAPNTQEVSITVDLISTNSVDKLLDFDNSSELTVEVAGISTANQITVSKEIVLDNRILTDYEEARTNRVISIDDVGDLFSSKPRTDPFEKFDFVNKETFSAHRYFYHVKDTRYTGETQTGFFNIVQDGTYAYINQYSIDSQGFLGYFDYVFSGAFANVNFYPSKYELNNYVIDFCAVDFNRMTGVGTGAVVGLGSTSIGDLVTVTGFTTTTAIGAASTILGISSTNSAANKVLVEVVQTTAGIATHQFAEVSIVHDRTGNDSGTGFIDYGTFSSGPMIGTFGVETNGPTNLNFYPNAGIDTTCAVKIIDYEFNANATGVGSTTMIEAMMESFYTSISASATPGENKICGFTSTEYEGAHFIINVEDTTNTKASIREMLVSQSSDGITAQTYSSEYGEVLSYDDGDGMMDVGLGTVGTGYSGGDFCVYFTPNANIATKVRVVGQTVENQISGGISTIGIGTGSDSVGQFRTGEGTYTGTLSVVKRNFNLTHRNRPIFRKVWDPEIDTSVVSIDANTIQIADHFLVSGEKLTYAYDGAGIATSGGVIGTTVYAVKVSEDLIRLAPTASDALATPPTVLGFTTVGTGNSHSITSYKQDTKCLIALDNNIQSPIVSTGVTVGLTSTMNASQVNARITSIASMIGGDIIKIDDEYMRVKSTGYGGVANQLLVDRGWLGSDLGVHTVSSGDNLVVTKYDGNYTIIGNSLNFVEPPYGEEGYTGLTTRSTFQGRTFIRAAEGDDSEAYKDNLLFDSVSKDFTGIAKTFTLTSDTANVTGFSTNNGVFLLNEIFQGPTVDYDLSEDTSGISSITFTGTASSVTSDLNVGTLPRGGILVNVGSSEGMGYQPLVAAGGTAVVSGLGTIESISIGNSGSGYRIGIQTVFVGVGTSGATKYPNITAIGTAVVENGYIVSIGVTNGVAAGYTFTNPPKVFIDAPTGYENIPLVAAGGSTTSGVDATVDITVGLGNSVTQFKIGDTGRNYAVGDVLTVPANTANFAGIPTTGTPANFKDFRIIVESVHDDKFAGWTFGQLEVLDNFSEFFNGVTKSFTIKKAGIPVSLRSAKGSPIRIQDNLIIFINDILQDPGVSYEFKGGSVIDFLEAPKAGDTLKVYYFKGSATDSVFVDIIETIKKGDKIRLRDDATKSSTFGFDQTERIVSGIQTSDKFSTVQYFGPGITTNTALKRATSWTKQKDDIVVDGVYVSKARIINQSAITPSTRIISNVGIGSTTIYVQSLRPLFDDNEEGFTGADLNLNIVDENAPKIAAAATAIVSDTGTISLDLTNAGMGYTEAPTVSISTYFGVSTLATATATVSAAGTVNTLTVDEVGAGYTNTSTPLVLIGQPTGIADTLGTPVMTGDFGFISGIAVTSVGVASTGLILDLYVNNLFRDATRVGTAVTISTITTGDIFYVHNSNTGIGLTSYGTGTGIGTVGIGSTFIDNIYEAMDVSYSENYVVGVGTTGVQRVTVSVSSTDSVTTGINSFFGSYTFGKLSGVTRDSDPHAFSIVSDNGITGLSTAPVIRRIKNVKRSY